MESFELILLVIAAILVSAVLARVIPRVSAPLIQIGLGFLIAYFAVSAIPFSLNPDFFLFIFIAPLLFHDAKEADRAALWTNRRKVFSLAVGLVFTIMVVIGFALHSIVPAIPLAAALAVGAALGPTDAVAVTSLKGSVHMTRNEDALLSGEALINDASGVVAFQFAIAAAVTDTYEVGGMISNFLLLFFGGIAVGIVLALIIRFIRSRVAETGLESTTFYVLLDVLSPFIIYLVAEITSTSGILAVVTAGLLIGRAEDRRIGPSVARLNIVTSSTWELIAFVLNGIIFILLGMQLCWIYPRLGGADALFGGTVGTMATILLVTFVLIAIRFVWVLIMQRVHPNPFNGLHYHIDKRFLGSVAALTIGGAKGAVTLSIIMSLPYVVASGASFPYRDQLIFLTSGIIVVTLLLANFLLPVLAPKPKVQGSEFDKNARVRVEILRSVIQQLSDGMNEKNAAATRAVIRMYNERIQRIGAVDEQIQDEMEHKLSLELVKHKEQYLSELMDNDEIDANLGNQYARRLAQRDHLLTHHSEGPRWYLATTVRHARRIMLSIVRSFREWAPGIDHPESDAQLQDLELRVTRDALKYLDHLQASDNHSYPPELIGEFQARYSRSIANLERMRPSITYITRVDDKLDDITRAGYFMELEEITNRFENDEISRSLAKTLRENVHLMQLDLEDRL